MKFNLSFEFSILTTCLILNLCFFASARAFNLLTCAFNLPTRVFSLPNRRFELITPGFQLVDSDK